MPIVTTKYRLQPFRLPKQALFAPKQTLSEVPITIVDITPEEELEGFKGLDMEERTLYSFDSIQFLDGEIDNVSSGLEQLELEAKDHAKKIAWNIAATMQLEEDMEKAEHDVNALKVFICFLLALVALALVLA